MLIYQLYLIDLKQNTKCNL